MEIGNTHVPEALIDRYWRVVERTAVEVFEGEVSAVRTAIERLKRAPPEEFVLMLNAGPLGIAADIQGVKQINKHQFTTYNALANREAWALGAVNMLATEGPMAKRLETEQMRAIREMLRSYAIPLIGETDAEVGTLGSCTLFQKGPDAYLLTAGHVVQELINHPNEVGIPTRRSRRGEIVTLNGAQASIIRTLDGMEIVDCGVIRLPEKTAQLLQAEWNFFDYKQLAQSSSPSGEYVLFGFPDVRSAKHGGNIYHEGFLLLTTLWKGDVSTLPAMTSFDPRIDLLLDYGGQIQGNDGSIIRSPRLGGLSGSLVWSLTEPAGVWSAEKALSPAGVEHAFIPGKLIRAMQWDFVLPALASLHN